MQQAALNRTSVCGLNPLVPGAGEVISATIRKGWRYYTILECGQAPNPHSKLCLVFKAPGKTASLSSLVSSDGRNFHDQSKVILLPTEFTEKAFTHNAAVLRLKSDQYVMVGGLQGFIANRKCRTFKHCRRLGRTDAPFVITHKYADVSLPGRCPILRNSRGGSVWAAGLTLTAEQRQTCATKGFVSSPDQALVRYELECRETQPREDCLEPDQRPLGGNYTTAPATGIRLTRGDALPWNATRWTTPTRTIITGVSPGNCIDRRPPYTGYPRVIACQCKQQLRLSHSHTPL